MRIVHIREANIQKVKELHDVFGHIKSRLDKRIGDNILPVFFDGDSRIRDDLVKEVDALAFRCVQVDTIEFLNALRK